MSKNQRDLSLRSKIVRIGAKGLVCTLFAINAYDDFKEGQPLKAIANTAIAVGAAGAIAVKVKKYWPKDEPKIA